MGVPQHISQRRFWRGKLNDTEFGTSRAPGTPANYKQFIPRDRNLANQQPNVQDDKDYGHGFPHATDQWLINHDVSFSHDFDLCAQELGRDLLDVFGSVTTTQPDVDDNPTVYQHLFSLMDLSVSRQLPSRSWVERLGSAINRLHPGVCCAQLALSGEGPGRLTGSGQWMGSGKEVEPSGLTGELISGLHWFYESQCTVKFDDGATITSMADAPNRLNSWRAEFINQLLGEDGFIPGAALFQTTGDQTSGEVRSELLLGDQTVNILSNVRLLSNDPLRAYLKSQADLVWTNDILGGIIPGGDDSLNFKLSLEAPKTRYRSVEIGERNGLVSLNLQINPLVDMETGKNFTVTLINDVPSYTA